MGAWVIVGPASYSTYAGAIGMAMYSFSAGMPIMFLAWVGGYVQLKYPRVLSVGDFAGQRFGPLAKTTVVLLTLFNMSIAMIAEYTTIGSLFKVNCARSLPASKRKGWVVCAGSRRGFSPCQPVCAACDLDTYLEVVQPCRL